MTIEQRVANALGARDWVIIQLEQENEQLKAQLAANTEEKKNAPERSI